MKTLEHRIVGVSAIKGILLPALLAFTYYPTFVWMIERWAARDSYYGHGFLIPCVSLYWIFKKRTKLAEVVREPDAWAMIPLALGGALQVASSMMRIYFLSAFSLIFLLLGGVGFLFGRKILRELLFPILFLILMIPLPLLVISEVTLKMKFFVAEIATRLIHQIGIRAVREGSYIYTPSSAILVGDPCSGLRSLLAFLCLGLVIAYESNISFWKKAVLVASGVPLALISNIGRVFAMGVLGEIYGMQITTGAVHDASGLGVFLVAFVLFLGIRKKLEALHAPAG